MSSATKGRITEVAERSEDAEQKGIWALRAGAWPNTARSVKTCISASFETTAGDLIIRIADQGVGLDPATLPDPLAPENLLRGSGRGIFLIRAFMDEVHFRQLNPGNEITLVKHRTPTQPAKTD